MSDNTDMPMEVLDAEEVEPRALAVRAPEMLMPVMNLAVAKQRLKEFQEFVQGYLVKDEDFGVIPGTAKPTLLKPGADKLCELYGLADTYPDARIRRTELWDKEPPLFDYEVTCVLIHKASGTVVAEGMGSCSSWEAKYRWRDERPKCPNCGMDVIKGKKEYGGGWLCWKKKGGCGASFKDGDQVIEGQKVGKIPNPDVADIKNTILKMAKKRAKIDATLSATRSSGLFTQDMEDLPRKEVEVAQPKIRIFAGKVADIKPSKTGTTALKLNIDGKGVLLAITDHGIDSALAASKDKDIEVEAQEALGTSGKLYWQVIRVIKVGNYDYTSTQIISHCGAHGDYPGEGNCPKCDTGEDAGVPF